MTRRPLLSSVLLLTALCALLYANSLTGSFQMDDVGSIVENESIRRLDPGAWWSFWPGRVLAYGSFALDHALYGLDVRGYHLGSILVHAGATLAVLWLAWGLGVRWSPKRSPWPAALAAAALFAAHPLQSQAVSYVVQRTAALCALFYVGSVACHVHGLRAEGGRSPRWTLPTALLLGLAAQFTKELAITLPAAVLLADLVAAPASRGRWRRVLPYLPLATVVPLVALSQGRFGLGGGDLSGETELVSRGSYWATQTEVVLRYLGLLLWPAGQNVDHDIAWRPSLLTGLTPLLALVHVLLVGGGLWMLRRGPRAAAFALLWLYLTLFPESSLFPIRDAMFEHRMYLPLAGIAVGCGVLVAGGLDRRRRVTLALALSVLLALATTTVLRNRVWQTPESLWRDAVGKSPAKPRPRMGLGVALAQAGRTNEARVHLEEAVRLEPSSARSWNNLGNLEMTAGRLDAAERAYTEAVRLRPDHAPAWTNLGGCRAARGDAEGAAAAYENSLELRPDSAPTLNGLAAVRLGQGRLEEAWALAERAAAQGRPARPLLEEIRRRRAAAGNR